MSQSQPRPPSWRPPAQAPTNLLVMVLYPTGHRALSWLSPPDGQFLGRWWVRMPGGKKVAAAALLQINAQKMKYLCRKFQL